MADVVQADVDDNAAGDGRDDNEDAEPDVEDMR